MNQAFQNKHICLTGGTDGIGLCLATLLVKSGASLLVTGRRKREDVILPPGCLYLQADLTDRSAPAKIANHVNDLGWNGLDHLIHNAGMGYVGDLKSQTSQSIFDLVTVNTSTPLALTQYLASHLERRSGSVCFIGSTLAGRATPDFAVYTATKTALRDIVRNLKTEWAGRLAVQYVEPGPTRTGFHTKAGMEAPPLAFLFMRPEDVAADIFKTLQSGKTFMRHGVPTLLYRAVRQAFRKNYP